MHAVQFENVSKSYPIYDKPGDRLKELLTFNRREFHRNFWALHDVSFEVRRGETFCVIGENGSGKSTLLQLVARILQPSSGTVAVEGRVSALLELGAGFNPEFTGRDNVYLNGSIMGLSTREIDARYKDIEEFAEIGDFINRPVKTYSSGMVVRLAFAVAINVDPEILIVDEALAVGDLYFRQRCMRKVHELRARGITILFVSHAMADVKALGDRALWLDKGRVVEVGATDRVAAKYLAAMTEKDSAYLAHHHPTVRELPRGHTLAPEIVETIPEHRPPLGRPARGDPGDCGAGCERAARATSGAGNGNRGADQHPGERRHCASERGIPDAQPPGHGFRGHEHGARGVQAAADDGGRHLHRGFPYRSAGALSQRVFVHTRSSRRAARRFPRVRFHR